jgi:predicted metalloendopeptidase
MCAPTAVAAARILESLDKNSDPCEDFYQFACGGWISQNPVPESQTSWDQFRALQEKLLVQLRGVWQLQWNSDTFQMPYMHQSIYTSLLDILHESVFHMQDLKLSQR